MAPAQSPCRRQTTPLVCQSGPKTLNGRTAYVGDLAPEELEALGPDAEPEEQLPSSWIPKEYRELLAARGIADCDRSDAAGYDGYLKLTEAHGYLEKRPNTEPWDLLLAEQEEDR
ncbi:hypothetical protein ACIBEJ_45270 [Nonomuraea sp. NPDC050790]|uniref:hypothetical protein n=1 Tax=Nonomuraea sp. NPDC050790 TaxID=3364371 RepID=UPI0037B1E949